MRPQQGAGRGEPGQPAARSRPPAAHPAPAASRPASQRPARCAAVRNHLVPLDAAVLERQLDAGGTRPGPQGAGRSCGERRTSPRLRPGQGRGRGGGWEPIGRLWPAGRATQQGAAPTAGQQRNGPTHARPSAPPRYSARMVAPRFCACSRLSMISTPGTGGKEGMCGVRQEHGMQQWCSPHQAAAAGPAGPAHPRPRPSQSRRGRRPTAATRAAARRSAG